MKKRSNKDEDGILKSYTDGKWFLDIYNNKKVSLGETKDWSTGKFDWPYIFFDNKEEFFYFADFIFELRERMMDDEGYFNG